MSVYTERPPGRNNEPAPLNIDVVDLHARAVQLVAQRFALSLAVATVVADLANLGPREASR